MAQPGHIVLLVGSLGSGKTCLVQGLARGLGIEDSVVSPSFVLLREYHGRLPLYHIDLYRLEKPAEVADLGLEDYLYGAGVSVVEWADRGRGLFPPKHLLIELSFVSDMERQLIIKPRGQSYQALVAGLKGWGGHGTGY